MKTSFFAGNIRNRSSRIAALCASAGLLGAQSLMAGVDAGKAITPAAEEQTYQNWVDFSIGGLILHGDHGQAAQQLRMSDNVFGGIEDLHIEQAVGKKGMLKLDGHALFGNDDYLAKLELSQTDLEIGRAHV